MTELPAKAKELIRQVWPARSYRATALTPDASLRRYERIAFDDKANPATAVAMLFDSVRPAEVGRGKRIDSDLAYLEATEILQSLNVRVPRVFASGRGPSVILIEDFGDNLLSVALRKDAATSIAFFELGLAAIEQLQRWEFKADSLPATRNFEASLLVNEMREFTDFYCPSAGVSEVLMSQLKEFFERIAARIALLPPVLVHRDFHVSNVMCLDDGKLGVIDFQDMLMGPAAYDYVSLLHDRDTDAALGKNSYFEIRAKAISQIPGNNPELEFLMVALQRDFKVVGRFAKLSSERGLAQYEKWIPGTLRRIGRSLAALAALDILLGAEEIRSALAASVPDIARAEEWPTGAGPWA